MISPYAELHCVTNFSFLRGASHPEELVDRAKELGYSSLAITDECSLAGVVRAHLQARGSNFRILVGAEFSAAELLASAASIASAGSADKSATSSDTASHFSARLATPRLVLLARNRNGYGNLSQLITRARRRARVISCERLP